MASTDIRRYLMLANKTKKGLFDKLSLSVLGVCGVSKKPTHF